MRFFLAVVALALASAAQAAPPRYVVVNTTTPQFVVTNKTTKPTVTACPNCTTCASGCNCFGGGYYCADGKCLVAAPARPDLTTTDGRVIRWNGTAYEFVGRGVASPSCPNGKCNLKR